MQTSDILRDIFSQAPSQAHWNRLCMHLGTGAVEPWALDYARQHLEGWPDALREAPEHWVQALLAGAELAAWPLVRGLVCRDATAAQARKLLKQPRLASLSWLGFVGGKLGPSAGIKALVGCPHLDKLRELRLERCVLGDEGLAQILGAPWAPQLQSLQLTLARCYNPRALNSTWRSLQALQKATHLESLRHLGLGGDLDSFSAPDHLLRDLARAPQLQNLESLRLSMGFHFSVDVLLAHLNPARLRRLEIVEGRVEEISCLKQLKDSPLEELFVSFAVLDTDEREFPRLCALEMPPTLRRLKLIINTPSLSPLLEASWAPQLRALEMDAAFQEQDYITLARHPALGQLESLTLERWLCYHYQVRDGFRKQSALGVDTAQAWLSTTARPHLAHLHLDLPFQISQLECEEQLAPLYLEHHAQPPYPAWEQCARQLAALAAITLPDTALSTPVASAPLELELPYDFSAKAMKDLLKDGRLERCTRLVFGVDIDALPAKLVRRFFAEPDYSRLEELDVSWVLSNPFSRDARREAILLGLAENPTLTRLETLRYCNYKYDPGFLPAMLKLKVSPHIPAPTRDQIDLALMQCFYPTDTREAIQLLCSCPELAQVRSLDLSRKPLGDQGARILAECPLLAELEHLDLSRSEIGDAGAQALAASPHLKSLKTLKMDYLSLSLAGAQALADAPHLPAAFKKKWAGKARKLQAK